MKKLSFLFAMIFAVSMAMGQNVGNIAIADQQGTNSYANTNQTGDYNTSKILQQVKDNEAYIDQVGNNNTLRHSKLESGGFAVQKASAYLDLDQNGNRNLLGLYQTNQKNDARVYQNGNDNKADVWQKAFGGAVSGNFTDVDQIGNRNNTDIYQEGDEMYAKARAYGDDNVTDIYQGGDYSPDPTGGMGHSSTVDITGNSNRADVHQENTGFASGYTTADGHLGNITQIGNNNIGLINQTGVDNYGTIYSKGNSHYGEIIQTGSEHTAIITQQ